MTLLKQCGKFRRGNWTLVYAFFKVRKCHYDYALRILDGRIAHQDAAHHAENCGIQANPYAECEDNGKTEGRAFPQSAQAVAKIGGKVLDGQPSPNSVAVLFNQ